MFFRTQRRDWKLRYFKKWYFNLHIQRENCRMSEWCFNRNQRRDRKHWIHNHWGILSFPEACVFWVHKTNDQLPLDQPMVCEIWSVRDNLFSTNRMGGRYSLCLWDSYFLAIKIVIFRIRTTEKECISPRSKGSLENYRGEGSRHHYQRTLDRVVFLGIAELLYETC